MNQRLVELSLERGEETVAVGTWTAVEPKPVQLERSSSTIEERAVRPAWSAATTLLMRVDWLKVTWRTAASAPRTKTEHVIPIRSSINVKPCAEPKGGVRAAHGRVPQHFTRLVEEVCSPMKIFLTAVPALVRVGQDRRSGFGFPVFAAAGFDRHAEFEFFGERGGLVNEFASGGQTAWSRERVFIRDGAFL